jgi:hypothetical protein
VLPHEHDGPKEPPRRRKSWVVLVPDDGEDGAVVLDTFLEQFREMFRHDDNPKTRYFTLVQTLALCLQELSANSVKNGEAFKAELPGD